MAYNTNHHSSNAQRCPTCAGQREVVFVASHGGIVDRPANGRPRAWPCPTCTGGGFTR